MQATLEKPKHEMSILDHTGDTKLIFDPDNEAEVENARETFNRLKKKGFIAYRVQDGGSKGEIMTEFDATAKKIILSPALRGG